MVFLSDIVFKLSWSLKLILGAKGIFDSSCLHEV